jgi:hypothetical protein
MNMLSQRSCLFASLFVALIAFTGCSSTSEQRRGGSLAAVEINHPSGEDIRELARRIFARAGYNLKSDLEVMVFEKKSSVAEGVAFGAWEARVTDRVKLRYSAQAGGSWLVGCDAYLVQHAGETVFEEEKKLTRVYRSRYQRLLDEVKRRAESGDLPR